jgi:hypothetical protein
MDWTRDRPWYERVATDRHDELALVHRDPTKES